jgi:hypothetical protein
MIIRITKKYMGWMPGETPDIMRSLAKQLIEQGIAVPYNPARGKLTEKQQTAQIVNENKPQPSVVVVPLPANTSTRRTKNNSNTNKK